MRKSRKVLRRDSQRLCSLDWNRARIRFSCSWRQNNNIRWTLTYQWIKLWNQNDKVPIISKQSKQRHWNLKRKARTLMKLDNNLKQPERRFHEQDNLSAPNSVKSNCRRKTNELNSIYSKQIYWKSNMDL